MMMSSYVLTQILNDPDINILLISICTLTSLTNLALYCYFGRLTTDNYLQFSKCAYELTNWYELPVELQKYLILVISNANKPLYYNGLGIMSLKMETLTGVSTSIIINIISRREVFSYDLYFVSVTDAENCNKLLYDVQDFDRLKKWNE